jgi:hypothetical protein
MSGRIASSGLGVKQQRQVTQATGGNNRLLQAKALKISRLPYSTTQSTKKFIYY